MKVSVCLIVYNQEKFIAQAVENVLGQVVDFDFELVVGDDASTDNTREIISDFQRRYPDKVRILLRDEEQARAERARGLGGKTNFLSTLAACTGDYIALLDGDDYWTDPLKLQKQANFLDSNADCAICFHDVEILCKGGSSVVGPPDTRSRWSIEDLLAGNFIHSCSVMFRNHLLQSFPDWYYTALVGDWPLYVMLAQHGAIGHIPEVMAAYRVHDESFWSSRSETARFVDGIALLEHFNTYLAGQYKNRIRQTQAKFWERLADSFFAAGATDDGLKSLRKALKINFASFRVPPRHLFLKSMKFETPRLYNLLRSLKNNRAR